MQKLKTYLADHLKNHFHIGLYGFTFLFLSIIISIELKTKFFTTFLRNSYGTSSGFWAYLLFFSFIYYTVAIVQAFILKENYIKSHKFWFKSLLFLCITAGMISFYQYKNFLQNIIENPIDFRFVYVVIERMRKAIIIIPILLVLKFTIDKNVEGFYGFSSKNVILKPYFVLLALITPFIVYASFQEGFQTTYPRFKFWNFAEAFHLNQLIMTVIYELGYSLNFACVELLFRGAFVIGMVSILGRNAILPVAALYCVVHFGKPTGEMLSSFFGGYLLGVFAFYSRNIWGGLVVHLGIAYIMEFSGFFQFFLKN